MPKYFLSIQQQLTIVDQYLQKSLLHWRISRPAFWMSRSTIVTRNITSRLEKMIPVAPTFERRISNLPPLWHKRTMKKDSNKQPNGKHTLCSVCRIKVFNAALLRFIKHCLILMKSWQMHEKSWCILMCCQMIFSYPPGLRQTMKGNRFTLKILWSIQRMDSVSAPKVKRS